MRQRLPVWARTAAVGGALLALVTWSFHLRWQLLASSPFPLGVDGYFYPIQLRALLDHGALAYPSSPLAFYLLAPFAAATDPITGAKLGAAFYGALVAVPAYGVAARLAGGDSPRTHQRGNRPDNQRSDQQSDERDLRPRGDRSYGLGAGLVAAALATTSTASAYLTVEFVKNSIGLTVALASIWMTLRAAERPTRPRITAALAGFIAAWATHKMAGALVLVVAVPIALGAATSRGVLRGRRLLYAIAITTAAALALLVGGALAPTRFLSPTDAALLGGLVTSSPHWTAPALALPTGDLVLGHDALLGLVLGIVGVLARVARMRNRATARPTPAPTSASSSSSASATTAPSTPALTSASSSASAYTSASATTAPPTAALTSASSPATASASSPATASASSPSFIAAAAWPILLLAIAIGLPFLGVSDRDGLGFRLRLAAFVPAALAASIIARDLLVRYAHRDRALAALALAIVIVRQPDQPLPGQVVTHPALVSSAQAINGLVPAGDTVIVPERHIAFLIAWYTNAPVALRPDRVPPAQRLRALPLHFIVAGSPLDRALLAARAEPSLPPPIGVHPRHPNGLVLVPEPTWIWILEHLPPADRARAAAWPTI